MFFLTCTQYSDLTFGDSQITNFCSTRPRLYPPLSSAQSSFIPPHPHQEVGYSMKYLRGRLHPKVQTLTLSYTTSFSHGTLSIGGCGGLVVSALDFRTEGRWFDAQSLPSCCLLTRQETLPSHCLSPTRCIKSVPATYCWG